MKAHPLLVILIESMLLVGCFAQQNPQTEFIFPFFAAGVIPNAPVSPTWTTKMDVINPGPSESNLSFEIFGASGELLQKIELKGADSIPPSSSRRFVFSGSFPLLPDQIRTGWIKVTASSPLSVMGSSSFANSMGSAPPSAGFLEASIALQPGIGFTEARILIVTSIGRSPLTQTAATVGIALTFPRRSASQQPADGVLHLLDEKGNEIGRWEITIPVNGQRTFLIEENFPQLTEPQPPRQFVGALRVEFPNSPFPVFAKAIFVQTEGRLLLTDAAIAKIK